MFSHLIDGLLLAGTVAWAQRAPERGPEPPDEHVVLAKLFAGARAYDERLHNFVCTEVTTRSSRRSATEPWKKVDTLEEEVQYVNRRQTYGLLKVNGKRDFRNRDQIKGFRWDDLLGTLNMFDAEARGDFHLRGSEAIDGTMITVIAFSVPPEGRRMTLFSGSRNRPGERFVGFHGSIWADAESGVVRRIQKVPEPPADFHLQDGLMSIDYRLVSMEKERFLIPARAEIVMRQGRDTWFRNGVEFRDCRKFTADFNVRFDDGK